jgi:hypothetical protein
MGCILQYLLTNMHPFDGEDREVVIQNIQNRRFKRLGKEISKPWHVLIRGMLRHAPGKRWNLLRITDHLYKHRFDSDASLTEDSDVQIEEKTKKKAKTCLQVPKKSLEDSKKLSLRKKSPRPDFVRR